MDQDTFEKAVELYRSEDLRESIKLFAQIVDTDPGHTSSLHFMAEISEKLGDFNSAVSFMSRAFEITPDNLDYRLQLATILLRLERYDEAIGHFKQILASRPDHEAARNNLATAYIARGQLTEGEIHLREAVRLNKDYYGAWCNLGRLYSDQARHDEAIECYRRALAIRPDFAEAHSNLLITLCYSGGETPAQVFEEHRGWAAAQTAVGAAAQFPFVNTRTRDRPLRIGYVSPDFREHSVAYFFEPVLEHHSREAVTVYCYSDVKREDATTHRLKALAACWRPVVSLTDRALAELVRKDRIDILVDLAGHTAFNRLLTFALKPAPVQVTWLGYPNTTGLSTVDFRITDAAADPDGQERYHTEKLLRLPHGFLCYRPPADLPEIAPPPCLTNKTVTFGSFNNAAKISDATVELWAGVLLRVPGSRLVLKAKQFADEGVAGRFRRRFKERGVDPAAIEFLGFALSPAAHLARYADVDISLDTFPYNGTTTTVESLLMGAPVISLAGATHASRVGVSLLNRVGLSSLVADSPQKFADIAAYLASEPDRLSALRTGLRNALCRSSLGDAPGFTRDLENAYRDVWRSWCDQPS